MNDGFQAFVVTAAAAAAVVTLVRPYFRKATPSKPAAPCGNCAASGVRTRTVERAIPTSPSAQPDTHR